jgi:uncharacterized protein (DUF427 family)
MAEVSIERMTNIKVTHGDTVVADSANGYVVHESGLSDRYYVPQADVRATLSPGQGVGVCPWKGQWNHLDVTVGGEKVANGAWTYFESKPVTEPTRDMVAFYDSKFQITSAK